MAHEQQAEQPADLSVVRIESSAHHRLKVESVRRQRLITEIATEAVLEWLDRHAHDQIVEVNGK
jgi:hypothetical protein